jgi:hypothetical protein
MVDEECSARDVNSSTQHHVSDCSHQVAAANYLKVFQVEGNKLAIELSLTRVNITLHWRKIRDLLPR